MALVNVEALLKPIEGENPCGENLRWDRRFLELERLAEGKEEQAIGDTVTPAEEPDWRQVRDVCVELFARGKHLRISVLLTLAALRLEGFPGLRDGMKVMQGLLEQFWDTCPPQLDAEDNNDPTERVNALGPLGTPPGTFGDKLKFLDRVQAAPFCDSRQLGKFSLRDVAIASGALAVPETEFESKPKPTLEIIEAAFVETDKDRLEEIAKAAEETAASCDAIDKLFREKCGPTVGPDLKLFRTMMGDVAIQIRRRINPDSVAADGTTTDGGGGGGGGGGGAGGGGSGQRLAGEVASTHDVQVALDKVIKYYESKEPSSPVPLVVRCALRLIGKPFIDIYEILDKSSVDMLKTISTPPEQSS